MFAMWVHVACVAGACDIQFRPHLPGSFLAQTWQPNLKGLKVGVTSDQRRTCEVDEREPAPSDKQENQAERGTGLASFKVPASVKARRGSQRI